MNAASYTRPRSTRPRPLASALVMAMLAPGLLLAQEDEFTLDEVTVPPVDPERIAELTQVRSFLEFGLGHVSDDAFRFGRYRGLQEEGTHAVFNLDYFLRGAHDAENADWLRIRGRNIGLDAREARVDAGRQGSYRIHADYSRIPTVRGIVWTPFEGVGGAELQLPSGWVPATTTAGMSGLAASLRPFENRVDRRRAGIGLAKLLPGNWEFSTAFRNEDRDGLRPIGAVIGNSGGNPRSSLLLEPIDSQTRLFDASARHTGRRTQLELRYHLSLYDNAHAALTWQNPYAQLPAWGPNVGYPNGYGSLALPPSNRFHQTSLAGGYNISERTRVTADLALGRMTQSDPFLPYTINPALAQSIVQPLPRQALDGRIDTTVINLRLSSRPSPRFHWGASYRYDERDNRSPRDEYVYIGGDSQLQDAGDSSSRRRFNEPASFREQRLRVDAGYRPAMQGRLSVSLEHRLTERTYSERERAEEDILGLGYHRNLGQFVEAGLTLSRADRSGSTYHGNEPFLSGYAPGYTATVAGQWENAPNLRKFFLADRIRDRAGLRLTVTPSDAWSIGVDAGHVREDYKRSELGLTDSRIRAYSIDASFTPAAGWAFYGFYTREAFRYDQAGASIRTPTREADVLDPDRRWHARHRDEVDTAGIGFAFKPRMGRLSYGADYIHSRGDGLVDVTAGAALTTAPLPADVTRMDSLRLHGDWRIRPDWTLRMNYWWEKYRATDWALDEVAAAQLANVILLAEESPAYEAHVISLSLLFRF